MLDEATDDTVRNVLREPTDISSIVRLVSDVGIAAAATIDPLAGAFLRGIESKRRLLEEAGGAYTTGEVATLLGISEQAVHARLSRNRLLAVSTGNDRHRFPTCQFTSKGVVTGIAEFLDVCTVDDPWTRLALLLDRQPALGNRSILDALRQGDRETALRVARSFGG